MHHGTRHLFRDNSLGALRRRKRANSENSQERTVNIALQPSRRARGKRASRRANSSNSMARRSSEALNCARDSADSVPPTKRNASPGPAKAERKYSGAKRFTKKLCTGPSFRHVKFLDVSL